MKRLLAATFVTLASIIGLAAVDVRAQGPFAGQITSALQALGLLNAGYTNGQVPVWNSTTKAFAPGSGGGGAITSLTGPVTASGPGAAATTITAGSVTNAMLAGSIAAAKLILTDITSLSGLLLSYSQITGPPTTGTTTYYVGAKANGGTCVWNGDGGTVCNPSDSNTGLTKALPFRTLAGARAALAGQVLTGIVTIQLADTAGTGTDCYLQSGNGTVFDMPTQGSGSPFFSVYGALASVTDTYPNVYIYILGDTTTPANVLVAGGSSCTATTSSAGDGIVFKRNAGRVNGVSTNYFKSAGVDCIRCDAWIENLTTTSDDATNSAAVQSWMGYVRAGGTWTITGTQALLSNFHSEFNPVTPLSAITLTFSDSSSAIAAAFHANEFSEMHIQGGTYTFQGSGVYDAFYSQVSSTIVMNATTAAPITMTFNDASLQELEASQFSYVNDACGSTHMSCTFTAIGIRASAEQGSLATYNGTSSADSASTAAGNSCVAQLSFPNYVPNACSSRFNSILLSPAVASTNFLTLSTTTQSTAQTLSFPNIREAETVDIIRTPVDALFAAPGGTTTTASFVMMGLGNGGSPNALITPQVSGTVMVDISAVVLNSTIADGCTAKIAWNTGAAPANGAAAAGTILASSIKHQVASTAVGQQGLSFTGFITGLTLNTQIYVDLQFQAVSGGTCTFKDVNTRLWER